jgi:hypothetical protein
MTSPGNGDTVTSGPLEITLYRESHFVAIRFAPDTNLTGRHGVVMIDALKAVMGEGGQRFALFADARGVCGTDTEYRGVTGKFFEQHRDTACIALINLRPIIRVVAEMFRVGINLQLRTFADETAARAWLRTQGIPV